MEKAISSQFISNALVVLLLASVAYLMIDGAKKDAEITELHRLIGVANQRIEQANQKIKAANLPEVSVHVTFRPALLGSGDVVTIRNVGNSTSEFIVVITRPSSGRSAKFQFVLDPNGATEIGHQEGWPFIPGDQVSISQSAHKTLLFTKK